MKHTLMSKYARVYGFSEQKVGVDFDSHYMKCSVERAWALRISTSATHVMDLQEKDVLQILAYKYV